VTTPSSPPPPGWFPDPLGRHEYRYFNGSTWTPDVSDGGRRFVDPLGVAPGSQQPQVRGGNGIATAAMTCGIIALLLAFIPFIVVIGIVLGILAIVFGIRGLRRSRAVGRGRGFAVAGIVTGVLAMLAAIVGVVLSVLLYRTVVDFVEPGEHAVDAVTCTFDVRDATVEGELTNLSGTRRSYTVFATVRDRTDFTTVDDLAPGATAAWRIDLRTDTVLTACDPDVTVNGPFPFGIEIDPVSGWIASDAP
jgi:hypothetical protein